ncbi:uncharacterized protein EDB93DRAFT_1057763, partial [Suillus bovinus]|uniref:uncharacterized protein n=1 Tax=Suillus bovinus TaxID=48563 RepID=UPI001B86D698
MVADARYQAHLASAMESKEVTAQVDGEILETLWAPFNKISPTARSVSQAHLIMWESDERQAVEQWGAHLDIYNLKIDKAPTMADIRLKLTETEYADTGKLGLVSWLIEGINLEDVQDALQVDIWRLPRDASATQKVVVAEKQQKLAAHISKYHKKTDAMTQGIELNSGTVPVDDTRFCTADTEELGEEVVDVEFTSEEIVDEVPAEVMGIWMP